MCGVYLILVPIIMKETRASILLMRIARRIRKKSGDHRYRARVEDERASLRTLIYISCTRPICESPSLCLFQNIYIHDTH